MLQFYIDGNFAEGMPERDNIVECGSTEVTYSVRNMAVTIILVIIARGGSNLQEPTAR
jgi:hypothetical protein